MDQTQYVLVELSSGKTLVGELLESNIDTIVLRHPLLYQIVNVPTPAISPTNPSGIRMREVLMFRKWSDFTDDYEITFNRTFIVSIVNANSVIISFYLKELENDLKENNEIETEKDESEDSEKGISGDMNINFSFEDEEGLKTFLESVNSSLENLIDDIEASMDDLENDEEEEPKLVKPKPKKPKKTTKSNKENTRKAKKISPKETINKLPYDENADPKDPRSWSDNPEDYLK